MYRRLNFIVSMCGAAFVATPFATVLRQPEFVMFVVGFGVTLLGIFFAIESVAQKKDQKT